eukprot:972206-Prymnesium_polylepis.1
MLGHPYTTSMAAVAPPPREVNMSHRRPRRPACRCAPQVARASGSSAHASRRARPQQTIRWRPPAAQASSPRASFRRPCS